MPGPSTHDAGGVLEAEREKRRLAYIVTRSNHGGAQVHVLALLDHFRERYDVHLATGEEGFLTDAVRKLGLPVTVLPHLHRELSPWNDLRAVGEIWRWLGSIRPALLHAHSSKAGMLARPAAFLRGVPVVFTAHGWAFAEGTPAVQRLVGIPTEWVAARLTDTIITVSEADRELARRYGMRPRRRLSVIHNGISAEGAVSPADPGGVVHLVCVARFSHQKDQALLVRALEGVGGSWRLSFVGDGPLEAEVRALAGRSGLDDRVEFLGARDDVGEILARSQIFVLSSNWEGFPITILEASRSW